MAISPGGRPADDSPVGTPGGRQNWVDKAGGLPKYVRMVAHALMRKGTPESRAIATAVNRIKRWAAGLDNVRPQVQAAAASALAEWEAKKGMALSASPRVDVLELLDLAVPDAWMAELVATYDPTDTLDLAAAREYVRDVVGRFANDNTKNRGADRKADDGEKPERNRKVRKDDLASLDAIRALIRDWTRIPIAERGPAKARVTSAARKLGAPPRLMALIAGLGDGDFKREKGEGAGVALHQDKAPAWLKRQGFNLAAEQGIAVLELAAVAELTAAGTLDLAGEVPDDYLENVADQYRGTLIDLAPGDHRPPYDWKHGFIPITPAAALSKAKKGPNVGKGRTSRPRGVSVPGKTSRSSSSRPRKVAAPRKATTPSPSQAKAADDAQRGRGTVTVTTHDHQQAARTAHNLGLMNPASRDEIAHEIAEARMKGHATVRIQRGGGLEAVVNTNTNPHRGAAGMTTPPYQPGQGQHLNMPAPTSSPERQRSAVKSNQGPGDSPLSTAELEDMAKNGRSPAIRKAAERQLEKRRGASVDTSLEARRMKRDAPEVVQSRTSAEERARIPEARLEEIARDTSRSHAVRRGAADELDRRRANRAKPGRAEGADDNGITVGPASAQVSAPGTWTARKNDDGTVTVFSKNGVELGKVRQIKAGKRKGQWEARTEGRTGADHGATPEEAIDGLYDSFQGKPGSAKEARRESGKSSAREAVQGRVDRDAERRREDQERREATARRGAERRARLASGGSYPIKADGSPDYDAMSSSQAAVIRAKQRGISAGASVDTDQGRGTVKAVTDRSVTVDLDNGDVVNIQRGTPGYDRIKPTATRGADNKGVTPNRKLTDAKPGDRVRIQSPGGKPGSMRASYHGQAGEVVAEHGTDPDLVSVKLDDGRTFTVRRSVLRSPTRGADKPGDQGTTSMSGKSRPVKVSDAERKTAQEKADATTRATLEGISDDALERNIKRLEASSPNSDTLKQLRTEQNRRRSDGGVPTARPAGVARGSDTHISRMNGSELRREAVSRGIIGRERANQKSDAEMRTMLRAHNRNPDASHEDNADARAQAQAKGKGRETKAQREARERVASIDDHAQLYSLARNGSTKPSIRKAAQDRMAELGVEDLSDADISTVNRRAEGGDKLAKAEAAFRSSPAGRRERDRKASEGNARYLEGQRERRDRTPVGDMSLVQLDTARAQNQAGSARQAEIEAEMKRRGWKRGMSAAELVKLNHQERSEKTGVPTPEAEKAGLERLAKGFEDRGDHKRAADVRKVAAGGSLQEPGSSHIGPDPDHPDKLELFVEGRFIGTFPNTPAGRERAERRRDRETGKRPKGERSSETSLMPDPKGAPNPTREARKAETAEKATQRPDRITDATARRMSDDQLERAMSKLMESGTYSGPAYALLEKELNRRDKARRAEGN